MKIHVVCWGEHEMKSETYNVDSVHLEPHAETADEEDIDLAVKASRHVTNLSISDNGFMRIGCRDTLLRKNQRLIVHVVSDQEIEIEITKGDYVPPKKSEGPVPTAM